MTEEWIGVQEYAQRIGKSLQTVYNKIKDGSLDVKVFRRGKMNGYLIKVTEE